MLVVLAALGWAAAAVVRGQRRWRVLTRTEPDGTLVVAVVRAGGSERVVRALGSELQGYELAAELELAREEAVAMATQLNG